jgi:hypothetical protein
MWNDNEAETALRRMQLKEEMEQQSPASDPTELRKKPPESAAERGPLTRGAGSGGGND